MLRGGFAPWYCGGQAVPIFHKPQPFQLLNSNDSLFFSHLPPPSPCARGEIRHQQQSILCSLAFSTPKDIYRDRYIDTYVVNWDIAYSQATNFIRICTRIHLHIYAYTSKWKRYKY